MQLDKFASTTTNDGCHGYYPSDSGADDGVHVRVGDHDGDHGDDHQSEGQKYHEYGFHDSDSANYDDGDDDGRLQIANPGVPVLYDDPSGVHDAHGVRGARQILGDYQRNSRPSLQSET